VSRRWDVHVHSTFSPDGTDPLAAYARLIDAGTIDGIGFAEHDEFWPGSDGCGFLKADHYQAEVQRWRDGGYEFRAGVEVDWMPEYEAVLRDHLARHRFDFVIASVHNLPSASISGRNTGEFTDDLSFGRMLDEYYAAVTSSLALTEFDVIGHVGVYARHLDQGFFQGNRWKIPIEECEEALASRIVASGKLLEVNTSGLFCAGKRTCAGAFLLERFRAHGGRDITLASDAHGAADVRRGFSQAAELLERLGFDRVFLPWDRENPIPLSEYVPRESRGH